MEEITNTQKESIVSYINQNLSAKNITKSQFAEAAGIDPATISCLATKHHKVSPGVWQYLFGIYHDKNFDLLMQGGIQKYQGMTRTKNRMKTIQKTKPEIPSKTAMAMVPDHEAKNKAMEEIDTLTVSDTVQVPKKSLPRNLENHNLTIGQAIDALIDLRAQIKIDSIHITIQ